MLRKLINDTAIYGGSDFIFKLIAFFTFPIIASYLSTQAYGVLELIMTVVGFAGFFIRCGLNNSVQRYYWDEGSLGEQKTIVSTGLFSLLAFSILAVLLVSMVIPHIMHYVDRENLPISSIALYSAAGLLIFSLNQQYILDTLRLHFSPWKFFGFSFLSRILGVIFGIYVVVFLNKGVDGLLFVQLVISLLIFPVGLALIRKDLIADFNWKWAKKLLAYGYPFIYVDMAYWLFASMDRWMLASMTSVENVGIYSVALKFSMIVLFVSNAFGMAWSPYAIKIKTDFPKTYRKQYAEFFLVLIMALIVIGGCVAIFSGELIYLLMPQEYKLSIMPLIILSFCVVVQTTQQITAIGISIERKTNLFARLAWLTAIVNLVANYILIPRFQVEGAAWATFISYSVMTCSYMYYTQKLHPLPIDYRRLLFLIVVGIITLSVAVYMSVHDWDWVSVAVKVIFLLSLFGVAYIFLKKSVDNLKNYSAEGNV